MMTVIVSLFIISIFLARKLLLTKNTRLIVAETGLTLYNTNQKPHHISWHDVRLFAICDTAPAYRKGPPQAFEITSEHVSICLSAQNKNA